MTPSEIDLVQESFAKVAPIRETAAELFCARLFDIAPDVRPMFKGDMAEQGAKLMTTLGAVVNGLRNLDAIVPVAERLAIAHVTYGVTKDHYAPVGSALLHTLETGLGEGFTPEVKSAWATAYATLSGVMIAAAYGDEAAAE